MQRKRINIILLVMYLNVIIFPSIPNIKSFVKLNLFMKQKRNYNDRIIGGGINDEPTY